MTPILYREGEIHPYVTFHSYGRQLHDSYYEAERWRAAQLELGRA